MKTHPGIAAVASVALTALSLSCLVARAGAQLIPIAISHTREFRPKRPGDVQTVEDAMAAVMTVTTQDLKLPAVEPLYVYLHNSTEAFAANAGSHGRRVSSGAVRFATAIAYEQSFHVNLERTQGRSWGNMVWTLAHEYTHNIEYSFSALHRGAQWIREGFADWVAAQVLHHLGWRSYSNTLLGVRFQLNRQRGSLPELSEIEEGRGWAIWAGYPNGSVFTYRFAMFAIDKLISKGGVAGMERYFRTGDFQAQFGLSWNDFYKELNATLAADALTIDEEVLRRNPALACKDSKIKTEYPVMCKHR